MEGSGSGGSINLGVNKISKVVVKRNSIHHTKQQHHQEAAVYNIDKSDFRDVVQKLTGSPAATEAPPRAPNPRLQRARPPPLEPVFSFSQLVPNPAPLTTICFPSEPRFESPPVPSPPLFSPLPPLTPGDEVWANACDSPKPTVPPPCHMTAASGALRLPQRTQWSAVQSRVDLPSSLAAQVSSVSPQGSGFEYPQGSHIPYSGGSVFPLSPSSQFGLPLHLPLPLSPGSLLPFR